MLQKNLLLSRLLEKRERKKRWSLPSNYLKSNGSEKSNYQIITVRDRRHTVMVMRRGRQARPGVRKGRDKLGDSRRLNGGYNRGAGWCASQTKGPSGVRKPQ